MSFNIENVNKIVFMGECNSPIFLKIIKIDERQRCEKVQELAEHCICIVENFLKSFCNFLCKSKVVEKNDEIFLLFILLILISIDFFKYYFFITQVSR